VVKERVPITRLSVKTDRRKRGLIAFVAISIGSAFMLLWLVRPVPKGPVLLQEVFSKTVTLTIRSSFGTFGDGSALHLSYHNSAVLPFFGTTIMDSLPVNKDPSMLQFKVIHDQELHLRCVCDLNECGVLILFDETSEDMWVTGRQFGWHGSPKSDWQNCLDRLKTKHVIPYETLPTIR
jgi:hypothetical protein